MHPPGPNGQPPLPPEEPPREQEEEKPKPAEVEAMAPPEVTPEQAEHYKVKCMWPDELLYRIESVSHLKLSIKFVENGFCTKTFTQIKIVCSNFFCYVSGVATASTTAHTRTEET